MIRVVRDDLATRPADAVVLPTTIQLEATTPASRRLSELGGERFASQRRLSAELMLGAAVVTGGGDLQAPYVIHAVLQLRADEAVSPKALRRAWLSALERAQQWEFRHVTAPLLGSGSLSTADAAAIMIEVWKEHGGRASLPADLTIVVETEEDHAVLEGLLARDAS